MKILLAVLLLISLSTTSIDACVSGDSSIAIPRTYDDAAMCDDYIKTTSPNEELEIALLAMAMNFTTQKAINDFSVRANWASANINFRLENTSADSDAIIPCVGWPVEKPTALILATCNNNVALVKYLIQNLACLNLREYRFGESALHKAVQLKNTTMAEILLKQGAEVDSSADYGYTPLMYACQNGDYEMVSLLLRYGADVKKRNADDFTPLYFAVASRDVATAQLIQKAGGTLRRKKTLEQFTFHQQNPNPVVSNLAFPRNEFLDLETLNGRAPTTSATSSILLIINFLFFRYFS